MTKTRSDLLRRRPQVIRYYYMAITDAGTIHCGMSHGGLEKIAKKSKVIEMYVSDLVNQTCFKIPEDAELFLRRWSHNYNDEDWDYLDELTRGVQPPRG